MTNTEFPSATDFLLNEPMYERKVLRGEEIWSVIELFYHTRTYDSYCPECGKEATFRVAPPALPDRFKRNVAFEDLQRKMGGTVAYPTLEPTIYQVIAKCARQPTHIQRFLFLIDSQPDTDNGAEVGIQQTIQKIGQHPSFGDLNLHKVKKYGSVLEKRLLGELSRAIGLASHDVGVGAYTYPRRVFEALIEEAHQTALSVEGWDEEAFSKSRVAERIVLLKLYLPSFLVEHPGMYSLLSKGIHELSEEECLEHFHTLHIAIELILDEKIERRDKDRKMAEAKMALSKAINKHA